MIIDEREYIQSEANGILDEVRGDKINKLMRRKYSPSAELRISLNMHKDQTNPKFIQEFDEHEAYYDECKATVDSAFEAIKQKIESNNM